jgi:large repetitive protein
VATGGVPAYLFSIALGSLPPGLTLSPTNGAITGSPTTSGIYTFEIGVQDSSSATAQSTVCTILVNGN